MKEEGGGYTFFWKGKPQAEDRLHGLGFTSKSALLKSIPVLPARIIEHLIKLPIPLSKSRHLTNISAYAPTLTSSRNFTKKFSQTCERCSSGGSTKLKKYRGMQTPTMPRSSSAP